MSTLKLVRFLLFAVLFFTFFTVANAEMRFHVIKNGEHCCYLIQSEDKNLLIDSGPSYSKISESLIYLRAYSIDLLIGTCPERKSIGAITKILDDFDVKLLSMLPIRRLDSEFNKDYQELLSRFSTKKIKPCLMGTGFTVGKLKVDCLYPETTKDKQLDECRAILKITDGRLSVIIWGDADVRILDKIEKTKANYIVCSNQYDEIRVAEYFNAKTVDTKESISYVRRGSIFKEIKEEYHESMADTDPMAPDPAPAVKPDKYKSGFTGTYGSASDYSGSSSRSVQVKGYHRKDGTYVQPHTRKKPGK